MADGGEGSQELLVEGGVVGLRVGQLPGEEDKGGSRLLHTLLENPFHTVMSTAKKMSQAVQNAASRGGVQSNSLPGPLKGVGEGGQEKHCNLDKFPVKI